MSFQITLPGNRRAAARFVASVRRSLLKALADNPDVKQTDIADSLGVHRAVITRQMKGTSDIGMGRAAEIAWALGLEAKFDLVRPSAPDGSNISAEVTGTNPFKSVNQSSTSLTYDPTKRLKLGLVAEDA